MTDLLKHNQLYAALNTNAALKAKVTGIYEMPPDNAVSPYIQVGEAWETTDVIDDSEGQVKLRLHLWSSYAGRREIYEIRDLVKRALPAWAIYDGMTVMRDDAEPDWWHGIIDVRYYDEREY